MIEAESMACRDITVNCRNSKHTLLRLCEFLKRNALELLKSSVGVLGLMARAGIRCLDRLLVRVYRIQTITEDPLCILKASYSRAREEVVLSDGTHILAGDSLIEIHLWNERMSAIGSSAQAGASGTGLVWAVRFLRRLMVSLCYVREWAQGQSEWARFVAVHGTFGFIPADQVELLVASARRLGFDLRLRKAPGLRFWTSAFWSQLWAWWLMWAYNPTSRQGKRLRDMGLVDVWMSRATLIGLCV